MPGRCALVIAAWAAALMCGCADYRPEPLSPAANANSLDSRTLDDLRLRQFVTAALSSDSRPAPPLSWHLTTLTLAALYYHPEIRIAQAKVRTAEAALITARERPNPVLNIANMLGQAAVAGAIPVGAAPVTIGPVIDLVLETAGKREARTAQAQHLAEAARWDLATAGWQVRGRVRNVMLDLWATRERLRLTRQRLTLQGELVQLIEHRLAAGEASAVDVARERISRAEAVHAVGELERGAAEARVRLATAVGIPVRAFDGADPELSAFDDPPAITAPIDTGAWRRKALTERADVQASLAAYDAAQAALQLAVANQYPNVALSPGYNYDLGVNRYVLNLGTTLPVFQQNQGPIAEAIAARQQAAAGFTAVQARIIGAIDEAETTYLEAIRNLAASDAILGAEKRREQQMQDAFRIGQVDRPTLLAAELEVAATALSRFDSVVRQREALGALEDALQRALYEAQAASLLPQTGAPPELSS